MNSTAELCLQYNTDWNALRKVEIFFLVVCNVVGTIGNTAIIVAIILNKLFRKHSIFFIINLSLADLFVSVYVIPVVLANVVAQGNILQEGACIFTGVVSIFCVGLSIYSLIFIALERYINICWSHLHKQCFNRNKILWMILCIWVFCLVTSILPVIGWGEINYDTDLRMCSINRYDSSYHVIFVVLIGVLMPSVVIIWCYARIFIKIRESQANLNKHQTNVAATLAVIRREKRRRKTVLTLFITFILFEVFWMPFGVILIGSQYYVFPCGFLRFGAWFGLSNSCINSFIYGVMTSDFREGYKKMFCFWKKNNQITVPSLSYSLNSQ